MISQMATAFDGGLDMNPESFSKDDEGFNTVVLNIPDTNTAALEKLFNQFGLEDHYQKLEQVSEVA